MKKWLLYAVAVPVLFLHIIPAVAEKKEVSATQEEGVLSTKKQVKPALSKRKKAKKNEQPPVCSDKKTEGAVDKKNQDQVDREVVNKIAVLIYVTAPSQPGSDKELEKVSDIVITLLDIERPSIDGRLRSLDDLILDKLMAFEATYFYRMVIPDDAIDKYINSIKEHYNIGDEQLRQMFKQAGYTYEEAREQLGASQAIDSLLSFKIRSRLVVPEKDVRTYYEAHPVYEDASYKIKKSFIPDGILSEDDLQNISDDVIKKHSIEWSTPYWLTDEEMTDERREMLYTMKVDEFSKPEQVTGGYEVIQLLAVKPRALKSFEERYREITMILQEPQYYKMFEEFKKELFAKYEVVYL